MVNPCLETVLQCNILALQSFRSPYLYAIDCWFFDSDHLVYDIGVSTGLRDSRLLLLYRADEPSVPIVEIIEVYGPWTLLNPIAPSDIIKDWILFGWRHGPSGLSTVARAILWTGKAMEALHAESVLVATGHHRRGRQRAPQGLLVIHNTRQRNWQSICQHGLCQRLSRLGRQGIWVRPPSFGNIERSQLRGNLSFLVDISGLPLLRYSSYELVVSEDIPLVRFQRIFDLGRKEDA